jgi:hypothetical protein
VVATDEADVGGHKGALGVEGAISPAAQRHWPWYAKKASMRARGEKTGGK